jgi:hypothetical protein
LRKKKKERDEEKNKEIREVREDINFGKGARVQKHAPARVF